MNVSNEKELDRLIEQDKKIKERFKRQNESIKENYDRVSATLKKGTKERILATGYTLNNFIAIAVAEKLDRLESPAPEKQAHIEEIHVKHPEIPNTAPVDAQNSKSEPSKSSDLSELQALLDAKRAEIEKNKVKRYERPMETAGTVLAGMVDDVREDQQKTVKLWVVERYNRAFFEDQRDRIETGCCIPDNDLYEIMAEFKSKQDMIKAVKAGIYRPGCMYIESGKPYFSVDEYAIKRYMPDGTTLEPIPAYQFQFDESRLDISVGEMSDFDGLGD